MRSFTLAMKVLILMLIGTLLMMAEGCFLMNSSKVEVVVPNGFRGLILVRKESDGRGDTLRKERDVYRLFVRVGGVVEVRDIDPLYGYVEHLPKYESGERLSVVNIEFWFKDPSSLHPPVDIEIRKIRPDVEYNETIFIVPNQPEYGRKVYYVGTILEFSEFVSNHPHLYRTDGDGEGVKR